MYVKYPPAVIGDPEATVSVSFPVWLQSSASGDPSVVSPVYLPRYHVPYALPYPVYVGVCLLNFMEFSAEPTAVGAALVT